MFLRYCFVNLSKNAKVCRNVKNTDCNVCMKQHTVDNSAFIKVCKYAKKKYKYAFTIIV